MNASISKPVVPDHIAKKRIRSSNPPEITLKGKSAHLFEFIIALNFGVFGAAVLATLVILSDIGGYVAGRLIGGRKFWPSISPNKTWSGVFAGWLLATLFGYILMLYGGASWTVPVCISVVIGSQLGDIAESWVKRRVDVKDSSNLIPGHGGVLDRFDGFIGGATVLGLAAIVFLS
jgi:phosphatidate cytidylyltransferase